MPTPLSMRGLMLDAARLVEDTDYYHRFLDFCADWKVNTVLIRLTDTQGCAVRFEKHPELLCHPNALEPDSVHDLVRHARDRHITLIPEIESFGHSRYITGTPRWAHLNDKGQDGENWAEGLIPLHPETLELLADLYRETTALFPGPWLHGGCDEVNWGGSAYSKDLLKRKAREQVWAEYLNALNRIARSCKREFIVWGDHVVRHQAVVLDPLDKNIVIHDWNYWDSDPAAVEKTTGLALSHGFRVIGGPAAWWCKWGPRIGRDQLRNIEAFADTYRRLDDPGVLGVITTQWVPGRYLQGASWDAQAYAAVAMESGGRTARETAFPRFVQRHFGARWNAQWDEVWRTLHDAIPNRRGCAPAWMRPAIPCPWSTDDELRAAVAEETASPEPFERVGRRLKVLARTVRRHKADFTSLCVTVEYLRHVHARQARLADAVRRAGWGSRPALACLRAIAREDRRLLPALEAEWKQGRASIDPDALRDLMGFGPEDRLLSRFRESCAYTGALARDPRRVAKLGK